MSKSSVREQIEFFRVDPADDREEVAFEAPAIAMIARAADGSVRDGLSLLDQAIALACENTTSISVPECGAVLMWNCARLASTSALVSDRFTTEPSAV